MNRTLKIWDKSLFTQVYTFFSFKDGSKVKAIFSFAYQWNRQYWKIIHHKFQNNLIVFYI
jgi:hypothetical protein